MSPARAKVNRRKAKFFRNVHIKPLIRLSVPNPRAEKQKTQRCCAFCRCKERNTVLPFKANQPMVG